MEPLLVTDQPGMAQASFSIRLPALFPTNSRFLGHGSASRILSLHSFFLTTTSNTCYERDGFRSNIV